jgi:hypothetical protein
MFYQLVAIYHTAGPADVMDSSGRGEYLHSASQALEARHVLYA